MLLNGTVPTAATGGTHEMVPSPCLPTERVSEVVRSAASCDPASSNWEANTDRFEPPKKSKNLPAAVRPREIQAEL